AGQTLTYTLLSGNVAGAFAIHSATGEITVADADALDPLGIPNYALSVQVSDSGTPQQSTTVTVTIDVLAAQSPSSPSTVAGESSSDPWTTPVAPIAGLIDVTDSFALTYGRTAFQEIGDLLSTSLDVDQNGSAVFHGPVYLAVHNLRTAD